MKNFKILVQGKIRKIEMKKQITISYEIPAGGGVDSYLYFESSNPYFN